MIIYQSSEFSKGYPDTGEDKLNYVASFVEARAALERVVAQTKRDYRASLDPKEPPVLFPYLEAKIICYVAQRDVWSSTFNQSPTTKIILAWRRYGSPEKERLLLKMTDVCVSRYRDNKPDVFWALVEEFFETGRLP